MLQKISLTPSWWGNDRHKIFTIIVFVILASLDNAARGVFPPLYAVMARDFGVEESSLGFISAITILVIAATAVLWGYWGDRGSRKRLLLYGTLIWSAAMFMTGLARTYHQLLVYQLLTAVGIGCIASVGFSVVSDFISPGRRGLAMSFWGLSQGGGGGAGAMLGGILGANNWPLPFFVVAIAGFAFAALYLFTFEPERGHAEPELNQMYATGGRYEYRIQLADIRYILNKRSNQWLMLQAFTATIVYGSLVWLPRLFIARVEAEGYTLETATISGNLYSLLFQTGFYFAILAGYMGDRWQRRSLGGRARLSMWGILMAIPFQVGVFFVPLRHLTLPETSDPITVTIATFSSIVANPWVVGAFVLALAAVAFSSADIPNRRALISDANLPEHRGTIIGFMSVAVGAGVALGNALAGILFDYLGRQFAPPLNYAVGLTLFQLLFIPAGLCYHRLSKSAARDIGEVKRVLRERSEVTL